jgi:nucleoside transporter
MTKPGTPDPLPGAVATLGAVAEPVPIRPESVQARLKVTLSGFMFVQYFMWGAWYPSMGTYLAHQLQFPGAQIGITYGAFAIGAIISPFFVGLIADRYFAAEKLLAVLGILGAVTLAGLAMLRDFSGFYPVLILYCAFFVPTLALGNSLAMQHLSDAKRDFPRIKVASAVGWIAGGVTISWLNAEQSALQFQLAAGASLAFAAYAFTLPHTPPKVAAAKRTLGQILGLDALALLKRRSFGTFVACLFLITIPLKCYFVLMSIYLTELQWANVSGKMALAQISDIVFLFVMPFMLHRLGYKRVILIGMAAWALRYGLLAQSVDTLALQATLILTAILLHGICYDFLYIAGQLYVNAEANDGNRSAAQGLIALVLWGVGPLAGTFLAGKLLDAQRLPSAAGGLTYDWAATWTMPAVFAAIVMIVFAALFRDPAGTRIPSAPKKTGN